jgi:hypothetical protein
MAQDVLWGPAVQVGLFDCQQLSRAYALLGALEEEAAAAGHKVGQGCCCKARTAQLRCRVLACAPLWHQGTSAPGQVTNPLPVCMQLPFV